eukprot:TRINITY_DN23137_c0_g1_i1.p1 TRINITY_DN23137_c0_g1~~TRINITY_DN23137_c0_g1_i1.p1  ORF type:complete len:166 (+),score=48.70 TRINITY_DN23137_c0_g1_i1:126-623(+)
MFSALQFQSAASYSAAVKRRREGDDMDMDMELDMGSTQATSGLAHSMAPLKQRRVGGQGMDGPPTWPLPQQLQFQTSPQVLFQTQAPRLPQQPQKRWVRILSDPIKLVSLHAYPFYGHNPSPESFCGQAGIVISTGCGSSKNGVLVRFPNEQEACFNPKAFEVYE